MSLDDQPTTMVRPSSSSRSYSPLLIHGLGTQPEKSENWILRYEWDLQDTNSDKTGDGSSLLRVRGG